MSYESVKLSHDTPSGAFFAFREGSQEAVRITKAEIVGRWFNQRLDQYAHDAEAAMARRDRAPLAPVAPVTPDEFTAAYDRLPQVLVDRFARELGDEKLEALELDRETDARKPKARAE